MNSRNDLNRIGRLDSQVVLLRDKFLFFKYMSSYNLPIANTFAILEHGKLLNTQMQPYYETLLKDIGFYKPPFGLKSDHHPDSGVYFSGFKIPMYKEAVELVVKAHKALYGIHSIGWDVAFTIDGPILIEGNDNWAISLMQACDRPLKTEWEAACK